MSLNETTESTIVTFPYVIGFRGGRLVRASERAIQPRINATTESDER